MSEVGHGSTWTPGPWKAFPAGVGEENGAGVAMLWRDGAEREANARMIAAAPDLYEALREAVDLSEQLRAEHDWDRLPEAQAMLDKMEAALAKARGE